MATKFTCKIERRDGRVDLVVDTQKGTNFRLTKAAAFKLAAKAEEMAATPARLQYRGAISIELTTDTRARVVFETMGSSDDDAAEIIALTISAGKR